MAVVIEPYISRPPGVRGPWGVAAQCATHQADRTGIIELCLGASTGLRIRPKHGLPIGPMPARVLNTSCLGRAQAGPNSTEPRAPMGLEPFGHLYSSHLASLLPDQMDGHHPCMWRSILGHNFFVIRLINPTRLCVHG